VIDGSERWEVAPLRYSSGDDQWSDEMWGVIRNGPLWGPEIYVEVVVRVGDGKGREFLLRAPHQWIERTE
jgi:hypothetical protein